MANRSLFKSLMGRLIPQTDTRNEAGGTAYRFTPEHALAQYAATGCLAGTYYATDEEQLATVLGLCQAVAPEFIARTAVYARERGFMKDMPALLAAVLAVRGPELLERIFGRAIDNGRMLRNFVQVIRSGVAGRKSLGTLPKRLVRGWLESRSDEAVFRDSVGNAPSLADIVKMVHPKPATAAREALYAWLIGRAAHAEALPEIVRQFEAFKANPAGAVPDVPFQMLTALALGEREWAQIARSAGWTMTRMNLNTFARHGVFKDEDLTRLIAKRLRDRRAIEKARVFPYQLLAAYVNAGPEVPTAVREALQDAMEIATANVPRIEGKVYVFPDVSGSMRAPVTGVRQGATTAVRCVDVAALVAASIVRKNPNAEVVPFEQDVVSVALNPRDSVMTNAQKLAAVGGGGTNCSAPLALLNRRQARGDLVIYVSDNESWVDAGRGRGTATMNEWGAFKARNLRARLVCIDVQPNGTTQGAERRDILNIGGFSDRVFEVIAEFAAGRLEAGHWVQVINQVEI